MGQIKVSPCQKREKKKKKTLGATPPQRPPGPQLNQQSTK